jgi:iron complex transport system substrate-binding protein
MKTTRPRIVSLLPSLTELVCKLGLREHLVGRSHECDYPGGLEHLPAITSPKYHMSEEDRSGSIHQSITKLVQQGLSVYQVDDEVLAEIMPDIILTQDHCEVCAATMGDLTRAVENVLHPDVEIVSVSPTNLEEIFDSFHHTADALGRGEAGEKLVQNIRSRFDKLRAQTNNLPSPAVVSIEWLDPIMTGGNWVPELIEIAGGKNSLSVAGKHSPWVEWEKIKEADPEVLVILPCGYNMEKTFREIDMLSKKPGWENVNAVKENRVYVLDGNHYFNRSGPRILESAEILAQVFHPDVFEPALESIGWALFEKNQKHKN